MKKNFHARMLTLWSLYRRVLNAGKQFIFMQDARGNLIQSLVREAEKLHERPRETIRFSYDEEADRLLNDISSFPHFFVLGCVVDRQMTAERTWRIPYEISKICGGPEFDAFLTLSEDDVKKMFEEKKLHRYYAVLADCFFQAIRRIHEVYQDDASRIWREDNPGCGEVIRRFREFQGVGQKISTMAVNILVRDFKINLRDTGCIDISIDSQIKKVFQRVGFVPLGANNDEVIQAARMIHPEYPGIFDSVCWEIGRNWCREKAPLCSACFLNEWCPKVTVDGTTSLLV